MFYDDILFALQKHDVQYAIVGGVAINLHGIPRMTADLDLIVDLAPENLKKLLAAMKETGYLPRLPVAPEDLLSPENRRLWMEEKNLKAFTFWNERKSFHQVDVLLTASQNQKFFERRKKIRAGGLNIYLASREDLIVMKEEAGREQDFSDIKALKQLIEIENENEQA